VKDDDVYDDELGKTLTEAFLDQFEVVFIFCGAAT
jgi:hypothetical protein